MNRVVRRILLTGALTCSLALLAGCDDGKGLREGDASPGLTGEDLNGARIDPARFRNRTVVLYFWRNSCCGNSLEALDRINTELQGKGVVVVADNAMDPLQDMAEVARRYQLKMPLLFDVGAENRKAFGVFGYPTIFIIDKKGIIRKRILGAMEPERLRKLLMPFLE